MHRVFVKEKLPYFSALIQDLHYAKDDKRIVDLKWVFPYFLEDFVQHIVEEEDHFFTYVKRMVKATDKKTIPASLWMEMENKSIATYALQHSLEDDDMAGIRALSHQYRELPSDTLPLRVLYYELKAFEKELQFHAGVENEVLFPKAYAIESNLRSMLHHQKGSN
jgi:regulator of cell morphogenesis and NO signaling